MTVNTSTRNRGVAGQTQSCKDLAESQDSAEVGVPRFCVLVSYDTQAGETTIKNGLGRRLADLKNAIALAGLQVMQVSNSCKEISLQSCKDSGAEWRWFA